MPERQEGRIPFGQSTYWCPRALHFPVARCFGPWLFFLGISCLFLLPVRTGASGLLIEFYAVFSECHLKKRIRALSVQFSPSVVPDSLRRHGPQHARPPCPSPTPGACSDSCPLSRWCHPAISSVIPLIRDPLIRTFQTCDCGPGERPRWLIWQNHFRRRRGPCFVFVEMLCLTVADPFLFPHKLRALRFRVHQGPGVRQGLKEGWWLCG